jgi:hypothetical protein
MRVYSGVSLRFTTLPSSLKPGSDPSTEADGRVSDQWLPKERNRRLERRRDSNLKNRGDASHERSGTRGLSLGDSALDWAHETARRPRRGLPALRLALAELARHYRMPLG